MTWRWLAVVVAVAGCKGKEPPGPASAPSGSQASAGDAGTAAGANPRGVPDLTAACGSFAEAACVAFERCFAAQFKLRYGTQDACRALENAVCKATKQLPGSRVSDDSMKTCISAVTAHACPFLAEDIVECAPPPGAVADGGPCVQDAQCSGGKCTSIQQGCGTCATRLAEGASCQGNDHDRCPPETWCNEGRCRRDPPRRGLGARCESNGDCQDEYMCASHTCKPFGVTGDTCGDDDGCRDGLACIKKRCAVAIPADLGKPCTTDVFYMPTGAHPCKPGLRCDNSNAKKPVCKKQGGEGDACKDIVDCPYWAPCTSGTCTVRTMDACANTIMSHPGAN